MSNIIKYFTLEHYLAQVGYTKASTMLITQNKPISEENIERIDIDFAKKTRQVIKYLGANNTDIAAIVQADIQGVIGVSVNIQSRIKDEPELNAEIEDYIKEFSEDVDVTGRWHFNSSLRSMVEFTTKDGGFLVRHHINPTWNIPYKYELMPVSKIDIRKHDEQVNIINGLKKDKYGRVVGVYLYTDINESISTLVSMKELIFFSPIWISLTQYTAVSKLASILPSIDNLESYTDSELKSAISKAKAGKYWKSSMYDDIMKIIKANKDESIRSEQLSTLMAKLTEQGIKPDGLTPIPLGDDVVNLDSPSSSVFDTMTKHTRKGMSASQGVASQIIYQDSSDSNYSSIKVMIQFASIQWGIKFDDLEMMVIRPILKRLIKVGVAAGQLNLPDFNQTPRKYMKLELMRVREIDIEPSKTANADVTRIEAGLISKREIARRRGKNYEDVLQEILEDELLETKMRSDLGVPKVETII